MCAAEKSKKGCLFYGCLGTIIIGLIFIVVSSLALYFGSKAAINKIVEGFTDTDPMELPIIEMAETELTLLEQRVENFREAIKNDNTSPPLELSTEEINALIFHDKELENLKGKVYLQIEENALKGQISIPLSDLNLNLDGRRYINGSGVFKLGLLHGNLSVIIESLEIKGKHLPDQIQKAIYGKNVLEDAQLDADTKSFLKRLKTFEVRDGKLLLELNEDYKAEIDETLEFEDVGEL